MNPILALLTGALVGTGSSSVTGMSLHPFPTQVDFIVAVEGEVEVRDFTMEGPYRLVLDLMGASHALPKETFSDLQRGAIRAIRASQFSDEVVRIVLEFDRPPEYEVTTNERSVRVTFSNLPGDFEPWSSRAVVVADDGAPDGSVETRAESEVSQAQETIQLLTFEETPIREVLATFAALTNRSIIPAAGVEGSVSAEIRDQPWQVAFDAILRQHGLVAEEQESGIILVYDLADRATREAAEPLQIRHFRVSYTPVQEILTTVQPLLSGERAQASVNASTNTLIVTDVPRVLDEIGRLVQQLDIRPAQVAIRAKIIFVNRTDLNEFGVTYDLKDSQGNQLNQVTPGAADLDGNGFIDLPEEQVPIGQDVVTLGGNSIAALGNANQRVASPTLTLLSSLLVGRHTLVSFIQALESVNLSDIEAEPNLQVMDNQQADILVGEETPIRVIDAQGGAVGGGGGGGAGGAGGGGGAAGQQSAIIPLATVDIKETGIRLTVTPHVTAAGTILLELQAERSSAEIAQSDIGLLFRTQRAESRVLVEDGETVVVGGLTVSEKTSARSGIPLLMNLPVVGRFFQTNRDQTVQRDLMILVTPHIVQAGGE